MICYSRSISAAAVLLVLACGDDGHTGRLGVPETVSLTITAGDSVLSPEETSNYAVEALDERGDPTGAEVAWSVSNPTLATIDAFGALTTTTAGLGTIYVIAEVGSLRDSVQLRITSSWRAVSVGEAETCAIDIQRKMWCWGTFPGTGLPANGLLPTRTGSNGDYSVVAGGVISACGVINGDGTAECFGSSVYNSLGVGPGTDATTPKPVTGGFLYDHVVLGREHGCGLTTTHSIVCWGKNAHGEVGDSIVGTLSVGHAPTVVVGGLTWNQVVTKGYRSCGLRDNHRVYCWGADYNGATGWPASVTGDQYYPIAIESDHDYSAIGLGSTFQCGLTTTGVLECWGKNDGGQTGNGAMTGLQHFPDPVSGDHAFGQFSTGEGHACALDQEGKAWCWGTGGLGHATLTSSAVPVEVAGNHRFITIAAGSGQTCGMTSGRALYCWGAGSLGDGISHPGGSMTPVRVRDP
jgi:alpha-tubulin suppressor-like RCC1 family protein